MRIRFRVAQLLKMRRILISLGVINMISNTIEWVKLNFIRIKCNYMFCKCLFPRCLYRQNCK